MSTPKEPEDVKLIFSIFSPEKSLIEKIIEGELKERFGQWDWISPELFFDKSRYYEKEMGWPLYRRFVSFKKLIRPDSIVSVKLYTNQIEQKYSEQGKRKVNIDPGYVCLERLVLVTGKNYTHRIYLCKGIYADLTLIYRKKSFVPLEWTYPDYAEAQTISFFNKIRDIYKKQLREKNA
ncbi:MAG: DUF4416 domain-containing protein [Deltaproteobacteria bacterium]|nr:MAG: DUF4416 domain-containing protein [Deltaproteobacteria bacterium]